MWTLESFLTIRGQELRQRTCVWFAIILSTCAAAQVTVLMTYWTALPRHMRHMAYRNVFAVTTVAKICWLVC